VATHRALRAAPGIVAIASLVATGVALAAGGGGGGGGGGTADPCPGGLEPNLRPIVPHHLQVQNTGGREFLRLTNGIANVGAGPWHLHPLTVVEGEGGTTTAIQDIWSKVAGPSDLTAQIVCSVPTTQFQFHPAHNHWHIGSVAQFSVNAADDDGMGGDFGAVLVNDRGEAQSFKTTFCLIDWVKVDDKKKTPEVTYWACDRTAPYQGVSVGWIDQYHHSLEGQEVDFTGAPVGIYYLQVHVNDDGVFVESDTTDNVAWVSFNLTRVSNGNPKVTLISHSPCSPVNMCGESLPNR
jgi:Lysyl oxidase